MRRSKYFGVHCVMTTIHFIERAMTEAEFARMNAGFDEHTIEHGNPVQTSERYGFVALDSDIFVGLLRAALSCAILKYCRR